MSLSCRIFNLLCANPKVLRPEQRVNLRCLRARAETWLMVAINFGLDLSKWDKAMVLRNSRECCCKPSNFHADTRFSQGHGALSRKDQPELRIPTCGSFAAGLGTAVTSLVRAVRNHAQDGAMQLQPPSIHFPSGQNA